MCNNHSCYSCALPYAWRAVWGMSQAAFGRAVSKNKREGYRPHDIEVYRDEGRTRLAGIFLKDPRAWQARWRRTRGEFDRDFEVLRRQGYTPIDIEVINGRGTLRYSSIWIENPTGPPWRARWGLTNGEFLDELEEYRRKGYRPIDLEIYGIDGKTRYAYVMIRDPRRPRWVARWGLTVESMGTEMDSMSRRGYRAADFEPAYPRGKLRLSAIFLRDARAGDWQWTMLRSSGQIQRAIRRLGNRYRPIHVAVGPHVEGGLGYLWIWQRN